tara:strand:- start:67622 stop:67894 length:273 start_codon:yes stop_codon:yes gene_type:complete
MIIYKDVFTFSDDDPYCHVCAPSESELKAFLRIMVTLTNVNPSHINGDWCCIDEHELNSIINFGIFDIKYRTRDDWVAVYENMERNKLGV